VLIGPAARRSPEQVLAKHGRGIKNWHASVLFDVRVWSGIQSHSLDALASVAHVQIRAASEPLLVGGEIRRLGLRAGAAAGHRAGFAVAERGECELVVARELNSLWDRVFAQVKALNVVNLEIFSRLKQRLRCKCGKCGLSLPYPPPSFDVTTQQDRNTRAYACGCRCQLGTCKCKQLREGTICGICSCPIARCFFQTRTATAVSLSGNTLKISVQEETKIECPKIAHLFFDHNFFNDPLPSDGYSCLEDVIAKYDNLIRSQKSIDLLNGWKRALEEAQAQLGQAEMQCNDIEESLLRACEICKLQVQESPLTCGQTFISRKISAVPLTFSLSPINLDLLQSIMLIVDQSQ